MHDAVVGTISTAGRTILFSAGTVAAMAHAGVQVVAGSDSHHCRDVGVYRSVRLTAGAGARA